MSDAVNGSSGEPQKPVEVQKPLLALGSWKEPIELASKAIVGVLGVTYVAGLLILNFYTRQYGLTYLGFLQIEYVMVGLLWLFLTSLVYCGAAFWWSFVKRILRKSDKQQNEGHGPAYRIYGMILNLGLGLGAAIISPLFVLAALTDTQQFNMFKGHWRSLAILYSAVLGLFVVVDAAQKAYRYRSTIVAEMKWYSVSHFIYYFILLIGPLGSYALYVFPKLSPAVGGGHPRRVALVIKGDQFEAAEASGLKLDHGRTTQPVDVVFEAPDFFLITPPSGYPDASVKAVRVSKDLIDGVAYFAEK